MNKTCMLLAIVGLWLAACKPPQPQFGPAYNSERQKVGLPIIPSNWQATLVHNGECTWKNPDGDRLYDKHLPVHYSKYLGYRTGTLTIEEDTYYGSRDYTSIDGTFREHVIITYHYPTSAWDITLTNQETGASLDITMEQAEKILSGWGISR